MSPVPIVHGKTRVNRSCVGCRVHPQSSPNRCSATKSSFELISAAVPQSHRLTFLYFSATSVDLVGTSKNPRAHNGTRIPEYVLQYSFVLNDDSGKNRRRTSLVVLGRRTKQHHYWRCSAIGTMLLPSRLERWHSEMMSERFGGPTGARIAQWLRRVPIHRGCDEELSTQASGLQHYNAGVARREAAT